jgi:alkylation response protein AidB-like acyl-CoA dehydrogenase
MMAVEIMIARQLTYYAARQKDSGRRCDLEAGMANLSSVFASATEPRGRRRFHR